MTLILAVITAAGLAVGGTGFWSFLQMRKLNRGSVDTAPAEVVFTAQDNLVKNLQSHVTSLEGQLGRTQTEIEQMRPHVFQVPGLQAELKHQQYLLTECEDFRKKVMLEREAGEIVAKRVIVTEISASRVEAHKVDADEVEARRIAAERIEKRDEKQ